MSGATIRLARSGDLSAFPAIEASSAETFARHGYPLGDRWSPTRAEQWEAYLAADLLWVAEDESGLVGILAAEITGDALYVADVDVVSEHQRRGLGRRLMRTAIDEARTRGMAAVTLETFRSVPWNGPFYASLGFRELTETELTDQLRHAIALQGVWSFSDRCAMRLEL